MPRSLGDGLIHQSHIDCMVEHNCELPEIEPILRTPEINEIARLIADNLVEDGATLQTGKSGHFLFKYLLHFFYFFGGGCACCITTLTV